MDWFPRDSSNPFLVALTHMNKPRLHKKIIIIISKNTHTMNKTIKILKEKVNFRNPLLLSVVSHISNFSPHLESKGT
jgi:putative AlgH/UPF0301 family transcriptional regulator